MQTQSEEVNNAEVNRPLEIDVAVIGAGPSGLAVVARLLEDSSDAFTGVVSASEKLKLTNPDKEHHFRTWWKGSKTQAKIHHPNNLLVIDSCGASAGVAVD